MSEEAISLQNLADGAAEATFAEAFSELYEAFMDPACEGKKGSIVLSIEFSKIGEGTLIGAVKAAKVKKPARKAPGRVVRLVNGVGLVDVEETGPDKARRLFPKEVEK